ncbi:hypothetical protein BDV35DRAFT_57401 [Aspergillus flavus]|uniref:Uncharacterized protein n=1 Tax=Aspergillus flavus TaxID=5059 RepID=A0A5N6GIL8_ASPFL|nr:hypothetical protein BDV35DRAFT_57401 [Aspergillus flavus]
MSSLSLRSLAPASKISRALRDQRRLFSSTRPAARIFGSNPLRAREATGAIAEKYPIIVSLYNTTTSDDSGL